MRIAFRSTCSPEHLEAAKRLGFEAVELLWLDYGWSHREEILRNVKAAGIGICAVLTGVERTAQEMKEDVDYAVEIGTDIFVIHPEFVDPTNSAYIDEFMERYAAGVDYAKRKGVRIAMPSCYHGPLSWDTAFSLLPDLKLKYDPSFSQQAGRNYRMELVEYGSRIVYVHAKDEMLLDRATNYTDGILRFTYAPAGMGDIHWGSVIALLYEVGFDGDIGIEPHSAFWYDTEQSFERTSREGKTFRNNWERGLLLAKRYLEQFISE